MNGSRSYLVDTNTATYIFTGRSRAARETYIDVSHDALVIMSAITHAELLFGLENKPRSVALRLLIEEFCSGVQTLAWDESVAHSYGRLRARLAAAGIGLSVMDMLIAAHAVAINATLVTHDKAFLHATPYIKVVDWAIDL